MILNTVGAGGGASSGFPKFTYTGQYSLIDDGKVNGKQNWRIRLLTSGVFTPKQDLTVDVFLVGGGASGCRRTSGGESWGSGGGGGYTATHAGVALSANNQYTITIGGGGASVTGTTGNQGGNTSACGYTAAGGYAGYIGADNTTCYGGRGGSGGAGRQGSKGGTNGGNGSGNGTGGAGQGTTTREFGEATGTLYSTGGDFGRTTRIDRLANTGDGSDGVSGSAVSATGNAGSGIVVIRNKR